MSKLMFSQTWLTKNTLMFIQTEVLYSFSSNYFHVLYIIFMKMLTSALLLHVETTGSVRILLGLSNVPAMRGGQEAPVKTV